MTIFVVLSLSGAQALKEQIHLGYCVRASDRRFEATEAEFIMKLDKLGLPVICVLTQVPRNSAGGYHPDALQLAEAIEKQKLPIVGSKVIMTMATADEFTGHAQHGLEKLLDASFRAAPKGLRQRQRPPSRSTWGESAMRLWLSRVLPRRRPAAAGAVPIL